jgi:DNA-binding CsgD family transcriptional regulator
MTDLFDELYAEFNQRITQRCISPIGIADNRSCLEPYVGLITMNTSMLAICEDDLLSYHFFSKSIFGYEYLANHTLTVASFQELIHPVDQASFESNFIEGLRFAQKQRLEDLVNYCFAFECRLQDGCGKYRRIQLVYKLNENASTGGYNLLLLLSPVAHGDTSRVYSAYHIVNVYTGELVGKSKENALTPKEVELLNLMFSSDSSKRIALHLDKSEKTVCTQRKKLYQKLGICCCHQANYYASNIAMIKGRVID